ncbi:hypothetical protein ABPG72_001172 [Tetrahymena utriculariae]
MEFQIDQNLPFDQKLSILSELILHATREIQYEENKLIRDNLFYERFINKQFNAKKQLSLNYLKPKYDKKQTANSQDSEKQDVNQMPEEVFENHIQENILKVIQKAEQALQEINEGPKSKFQKPEISPYEQNSSIKKPPINKIGVKPSKPLPAPQNQDEKPQLKKNYQKVILHKQSQLQTTYNSSFSNKGPTSSNRSNSTTKSNLNTPTQSLIQRQNSLTAKNQTSHANPLYMPKLQKEASKDSQTAKQNHKIPNQIQQNQQKINQNTKRASIESSQQQEQLKILKQKEQSFTQDQSNSFISSLASTQTQIDQKDEQNKKNFQPNKNQIQNQQQSLDTKRIQFNTFQDGSDIFESMDKNNLQSFYNSKKKLLQSQKEYQQQSKYYKQKEQKSRAKFLNKLTSHFRERHLVTQGKLIQQDQKKSQEKNLGQQNSQKGKKFDKYDEDQEKNEENQSNPFYEYTFLSNEQDDQESQVYNQIKQLTITISAVQQYAKIILQNINLRSENEEIIFLNQIKSDKANMEKNKDLLLLFRVWYFIKNIENNYAIFRKINQDTQIQINKLSNYLKQSYFSQFLDQRAQKDELEDRTKSTENEIKIIQFQVQDKNIIRYLEQPVINKADHYLIYELNKITIKNVIFQFIEKYLIQNLESSILSVINQPKINFKNLQYNLKLIRAISGIVDYEGKIMPSFFLTDSIQNYFEDKQE